MKSHKYWSLGALATMIGTIYTGYKNMKSAHKYFACSSLLCRLWLSTLVIKCFLQNPGKRKTLFLKNPQNN